MTTSQNTGQDPNGPLMTAEEVAELLGVPVSWVYDQARQHRLPVVYLGRYRRFERGAIERFIAEGGSYLSEEQER